MELHADYLVQLASGKRAIKQAQVAILWESLGPRGPGLRVPYEDLLQRDIPRAQSRYSPSRRSASKEKAPGPTVRKTRARARSTVSSSHPERYPRVRLNPSSR